MGAASSTTPVSGVAINPRLEYADGKTKADGEHTLLDAPSLVKLQHGTVRYRFIEDGNPINQSRVERPHETQEHLNKKGGYFYHSRLKDYGQDANAEEEDAFKFCYVYKGAERTRQKQLFYVFGKGLKSNENGFIEPKYKGHVEQNQAEEEKFYKYHGHMYYDIEYSPEDETDNATDANIEILGDGKVETDRNELELVVKAKEKASLTKRRLAIKLYKPAANIHLYRDDRELENDDTVLNLKEKRNSKKCVRIRLIPKSPDHEGIL